MATQVGENVRLDVQGKTLTITVDLEARSGPSKSGKTIKVASTLGNVSVPGHDALKLGLKVYETR